jgi:hypothetical protein
MASRVRVTLLLLAAAAACGFLLAATATPSLDGSSILFNRATTPQLSITKAAGNFTTVFSTNLTKASNWICIQLSMLWQQLTSAVLLLQQLTRAGIIVAAQSFELILSSYQKQLQPMLQLATAQVNAPWPQIAVSAYWPHILNVVLVIALLRMWRKSKSASTAEQRYLMHLRNMAPKKEPGLHPIGGLSALHAALPHAAAILQASPLLRLFTMTRVQELLSIGNLADLANLITAEMLTEVRNMPCLNINRVHGTDLQETGLQAATALALLLMHLLYGLNQQQAMKVQKMLPLAVVRGSADSWSAASSQIYKSSQLETDIEAVYKQVMKAHPAAAEGRARNKYAKVAAFMMVARVMHHLPVAQ